MNHQPFEEWIFSEKALSPDQRLGLENHLSTCADCRQLFTAWQSAEDMLHEPVTAGPDQGFALRWQANAVADQARRRRRFGSLLILLILLAVAGLILASLSVFVWSYGGPANAIIQATDTLTQYWTILIASFRVSSIVVQQFPAVSLLLIWGLLGAISILFLIWLASYYQLTTQRRTLT
jgi:predicted anti-sigma-YlaC factor YlaD